MEKEEYRKHFDLEESFWWFAGRRRVIKAVLDHFLPENKDAAILDAGCGTGYNLIFLEQYGRSFGCDLSEHAVRFSLMRGLRKIARADLAGLPFKPASFRLVTLLDVLYHKDITSDLAVLGEMGKALEPGGYLLITDSAFKFLSSRHDVAFHARERYTKKILAERLEQTGFTLLKISYFNFFLFLPVLLVRLAQKLNPFGRAKAESDLKPVNRRLNGILYGLLKSESRLIRRVRFPFGSSIVCLARKR
jgi:SAM-dependent methyltransferase